MFLSAAASFSSFDIRLKLAATAVDQLPTGNWALAFLGLAWERNSVDLSIQAKVWTGEKLGQLACSVMAIRNP